MFPRRWHDTGKCGDIASHIPEWVEQGARWIGEYCGATSTEMGLSIGSSLSLFRSSKNFLDNFCFKNVMVCCGCDPLTEQAPSPLQTR